MQAGTLYCLFGDGSVEAKVPGVGISNGIVWSLDNMLMYFIDTPTGRVDAFDYDLETGNIANRRPAISRRRRSGASQGMARGSTMPVVRPGRALTNSSVAATTSSLLERVRAVTCLQYEQRSSA